MTWSFSLEVNHGRLHHHCGFGGGMVHLFRLIFLLVALFSGVANASGVVPGVSGGFKSTWSGSSYGPPAQVFYGPTRQSIADQFCPLYVAIYGTTYGGCNLSVDGNRVNANSTSWNNFGPAILVDATYQACPANSTSVNGACVCNEPLISNGTACVVDPTAAYCASLSGSLVVGAWSSTTRDVSAPKAYCSVSGAGNCAATLRVTYCGTHQDGSTTCEGEGTLTGATCTPAPDPLTPTAPDAPSSSGVEIPPKGTCPGTVNGVTVNLPCSATTTATVKDTVSDDGAGNVGGKVENKNTECIGKVCNTTTTTTTTINGNSTTSSSSTTQSKGGFCAENPGSPECGDGDGSSFGGNCEASFVCEGDAIQCAIAKEIHLQNCKINQVTDESALYGASKNNDGSQIGDLPGNETVNFGAGSFNTTNLLGAQTCIADKTITVVGQSVTLPFSNVCQYLELLGNLLLSVSFLLAGRILVRG